MTPLLASFNWQHAVTLIVGLVAAIVALLPARRLRGRPADKPSAERLASIEARLDGVEQNLAEHRAETREGMRQILDHLLRKT